MAESEHDHIDLIDRDIFALGDFFGIKAVGQIEQKALVALALELAEIIVESVVAEQLVVRSELGVGKEGLDWKIVILCGLDEYKEEHSIGGVTVDGPSMEPEALYVLPPLPDKEWVEECVLNTDFEFLLRERQAVKRGEEKRLLYVGFTRAKEVVITVAMSTSPGVIETLCPTARNRANKAPTDATHVDIWGIPGLDSRYGVFQPDPDLTAPGVAAPERYKEAGITSSPVR